MALPTVTELREYLRSEAVDDALLGRLLVQAVALVEAYLRVPLLARALTVEVAPLTSYSAAGVSVTRLTFPFAPVQATGVVVEVEDGTTVASADYTVSGTRGWITPAAGVTFDGVYRVTATVGLALRTDYAAFVEPVVSAAIIDTVADFYQRRNPAASYESAGGGVSVNYNESINKGLPSRVRTTLAPFRRVLV